MIYPKKHTPKRETKQDRKKKVENDFNAFLPRCCHCWCFWFSLFYYSSLLDSLFLFLLLLLLFIQYLVWLLSSRRLRRRRRRKVKTINISNSIVKCYLLLFFQQMNDHKRKANSTHMSVHKQTRTHIHARARAYLFVYQHKSGTFSYSSTLVKKFSQKELSK